MPDKSALNPSQLQHAEVSDKCRPKFL